MGEAKQRKLAETLTAKLADSGKLLEAQWNMFASCYPDLTESEKAMMSLAYMAGCDSTFSGMISMMDAGEEPTEQDLDRMVKMHNEVDNYRNVLRLAVGDYKGSA